MSEGSVEIVPTEDSLYHRYPGQCEAQRCYVWLECERRRLSAAYDRQLGAGTPIDVYHGRTLRWHIPVMLRRTADRLLAAIKPWAETVVAGYSSAWDGHNMRGVYDDAARAAMEEIGHLCEVAEGDLVVWEAGDWLEGIGTYHDVAKKLGITAESTDDDLDRVAEGLEEEAVAADIHVLNGTRNYLFTVRERLQD